MTTSLPALPTVSTANVSVGAYSASSPTSVAADTGTSNYRSERNQHFVPQQNVKRPEGDHRSAEQIINDNPILKNLGFQKDIKRELAYERLGDWTANNPDPESRADAAFNAARVLNWIDTSLTAKGKSRGKYSDNGDLEGITRSGDARRGTPAGMWKDFTEQGYRALRSDHRLDPNSSRHVTSNGTNNSNAAVIFGKQAEDQWNKF